MQTTQAYKGTEGKYGQQIKYKEWSEKGNPGVLLVDSDSLTLILSVSLYHYQWYLIVKVLLTEHNFLPAVLVISFSTTRDSRCTYMFPIHILFIC